MSDMGDLTNDRRGSAEDKALNKDMVSIIEWMRMAVHYERSLRIHTLELGLEDYGEKEKKGVLERGDRLNRLCSHGLGCFWFPFFLFCSYLNPFSFLFWNF